MREQLEREIKDQEAKLNSINPFSEEYAAEQSKLNEMIAQLEAMKAQENVASQFENITFGEGPDAVTYTLRELCKDEDFYQIASALIQKSVGDLTKVVSSYQTENAALKEQVQEIGVLRTKVIDLQGKLTDAEMKRDAAATELEEAKAEAIRLKEENESLRKQLEVRHNPNSDIDLLALAKKKKAEEEAAKPGIYDVHQKDGKTFTAKLSETGEEIEIPWLEIGRYRKESAEDALRFRQEKEEREARESMERYQNQDITPVIPTFQDEPEDAGLHTGEGSTLDGTVEDAPVTRAEFEALKQQVRGLEQQVNGRAVA